MLVDVVGCGSSFSIATSSTARCWSKRKGEAFHEDLLPAAVHHAVAVVAESWVFGPAQRPTERKDNTRRGPTCLPGRPDHNPGKAGRPFECLNGNRTGGGFFLFFGADQCAEGNEIP